MKKGIKLTRKEKEFLSDNGYDPNVYLRVKKLSYHSEFINVNTGKLLKIQHGGEI